MLQGFNWDSAKREGGTWYQHLKSNVELIQQLGVSAVWLPPPSDSVSAEGNTQSQQVFVT